MHTDLKTLKSANDALDDSAELQSRLAEDGYLFFKRLFNPDVIMKLRKDLLTVMQKGGWLVAGTDPMEGIADISKRCTEGDPDYPEVYHEVYKVQSFHQTAHHPDVLAVMGKIIGGRVFPHPSKIARLWFPQFTDHTTPVHQDFVHFQGSYDTFTCWSPVGDCPVELGGLAVLPGSHRVDKVLDHAFSLGAGSLSVDTSEHEGSWHTIDYEAGDALIFPSLTLHKALPNVTEDRLRVSLDNRYQNESDPVAEHMLQPHLSNFSPLSWEEVYTDWTDETLKYYWKDREGPVLGKDSSYQDKAFDEAIALASNGDEHARLHLERIAHRDPESAQGKAAAAALTGSD